MKTLYLFRHAKSAAAEPGQTDHERTLLPKGIERTRRMTAFMLERDICPDLLLSSSARRAWETAAIIAKELKIRKKFLQTDDILYEASAYEYFDVLKRIPDDFTSAMIFAHNGAITDFADFFLKEQIEWLPTSGLVSIVFEVKHWSDIDRSTICVADGVMTPKMLQEDA